MAMKWSALAAAGWLLVAMHAGAQQKPAEGYQRPMFKCKDAKGKVSYSNTQCPDAKQVGEKKPAKPSERHKEVSQDRAKRTQVATRPAAIREECGALEKRMAEEQARLKALPQPATAGDEKDLVNDRIRFKKLKC
jgi:hypothetical protein